MQILLSFCYEINIHCPHIVILVVLSYCLGSSILTIIARAVNSCLILFGRMDKWLFVKTSLYISAMPF